MSDLKYTHRLEYDKLHRQLLFDKQRKPFSKLKLVQKIPAKDTDYSYQKEETWSTQEAEV